jgi:hypothetical protein
VAAYNKEQQRACCEGRYAFEGAGVGDSMPLDRTMAFHVRTPKSVFRLGGWGSLASFIMPPALASNVLCNPSTTCKHECAEVVRGKDSCTSMIFGDVTLTGGSGCADFVTKEPLNPHRVDVEACHRFNATAASGGSVCRNAFLPFEADQATAVNLSDQMYDACKGGIERMDKMKPWEAVSCFKYCHTYCKPNTDRKACEPGMTVAECSASMLGGKRGLQYPRCDPNNSSSPGYWCDGFVTKFCKEHKGANQSSACACFQVRDDVATGGNANIPKCGNAACGAKTAYQTLHTKVSPCDECSIFIAQNNCVQVSGNTVTGGGSLDVKVVKKQKQNVDLSGSLCSHAEEEDQYVVAREAIFHDLRPFRWDDNNHNTNGGVGVGGVGGDGGGGRDGGGGDGGGEDGKMFYSASAASAKGDYNVTRSQPDGWTGLCIGHVVPFANVRLSLETTHMGCKISMGGAETGCAVNGEVPTPAIFDDFAVNGVQAFSTADCKKRAEHHGKRCSAVDGVVKGFYRSTVGGACIITPPIGAPVCADLPHLPRTMFDAWYYTDDGDVLSKQGCVAYRDKVRAGCGSKWNATVSDWQPSEAPLANASCQRGMIHELDAGDSWDRAHSYLLKLFEPQVAGDFEFRTPSEPNNKFARLCAALCENNETCVGFEWDSRKHHCTFFSHDSDVSSAGNGGGTPAPAADVSAPAPAPAPSRTVTVTQTTGGDGDGDGDGWMYASVAAAVAAIVAAVVLARRGSERRHGATATAAPAPANPMAMGVVRDDAMNPAPHVSHQYVAN